MVVVVGGLRNITLAIVGTIIILTVYLTSGGGVPAHPYKAFSSVEAKNRFYGIPETEFHLPTMAEESEKYFREEAEREAKRKGEEDMLKKQSSKDDPNAPKVEGDIDFQPPNLKPGAAQRLRRYIPHNYKGPGNPTFATYFSVPTSSLKEPSFVAIMNLAYRLLWDPATKSSIHPFTVFVSPETSEAQRTLLSAMGCLIREMDPLPHTSPKTALLPPAYDLLNLWSQTHFSRILYLTPNAHPLTNIDEIFDLAQTQTCDFAKLGLEDASYATGGKEMCRYVFLAATKTGSFDATGQATEVDPGVIVLTPNTGMRKRLGREVGKLLGVVEDKGADGKTAIEGGKSKAEGATKEDEIPQARPDDVDLPRGGMRLPPGEKPLPGAAALDGVNLKPAEKAVPSAAAAVEGAKSKPGVMDEVPLADVKAPKQDPVPSERRPVPGEAPIPGDRRPAEAGAPFSGEAPFSGGQKPAPGADRVPAAEPKPVNPAGEKSASDAAPVPANDKKPSVGVGGAPVVDPKLVKAPPGQNAAPGVAPPNAADRPDSPPKANTPLQPQPPRKPDPKPRLTTRDEASKPKSEAEKDKKSPDAEKPKPLPSFSSFLHTMFSPGGAFPYQVLDRKWNGVNPTEADEKVLKVVNAELWRRDGAGETVEWLRGVFRRTHDEMAGLVDGEAFPGIREEDGVRAYW